MKIGSIFGIQIQIHPSMIIAIVLAIWLGCIDSLPELMAVLFCHEAAHVLAARLMGHRVTAMEWLPIGGVARMDAGKKLSPAADAVIALAGPVGNILLAMIFVFIASYHPSLPVESFVEKSLFMAGMNLLPGLPLDGGRVLRACLSRIMGYNWATKLTAWIGFLLAAGLLSAFIYGAVYQVWNFTLFFLSLFLTMGAFREIKAMPYQLMRDIHQRQRILRYQRMLPVRHMAVDGSMTLEEVVSRLVPYRYHIIHIVDAQYRKVASLDESEVLDALIRHGPLTPVRELER